MIISGTRISKRIVLIIAINRPWSAIYHLAGGIPVFARAISAYDHWKRCVGWCLIHITWTGLRTTFCCAIADRWVGMKTR